MTATEFQDSIKPLLRNKLAQLEVEVEWTAFSGVPYQYCPRVDVAIGPFSTTPGEDKIQEYNQLLRRTDVNDFLQQIYEFHVFNIGDEWLNEITIPEFDFLIQQNQNARCLCALEIENTSTKKHIMGSMINAASLGRVGVGVAFTDSVKRSFIRILNYLAFLKRVEKNTYDTSNFLVVTKEQLETILR